MSLFSMFRGGKKDLSAPSPSSRVVDTNGAPAVKLYPANADAAPTHQQKDLVLAVAIVAEDIQREGAQIGKFHTDPTLNLAPNLFCTLNGQALHVFVRVSRPPNMPALDPTAKNTVPHMARKNGAVAYFAPVGLMTAGEDGEFFVNYRGCYKL